MNNPLLTEAIGVYFLDMDTAVEEEVHPNEDGSFSIFFTHPISCVLIVIAVVSLMLPLITYFVKKKRGKNEEAAAE